MGTVAKNSRSGKRGSRAELAQVLKKLPEGDLKAAQAAIYGVLSACHKPTRAGLLRQAKKLTDGEAGVVVSTIRRGL